MSGANSGYKTVFEGLYDVSKVMKLVPAVVAGFLFPKVHAHPRFTANGKKSPPGTTVSVSILGLQFQVWPAEGTLHRVSGAHCPKPY